MPLLKAEGCCFPSPPTPLLLTDRAHPVERLEEAAPLLEQIAVISQITAAQRGKLARPLCAANDSLQNNLTKGGGLSFFYFEQGNREMSFSKGHQGFCLRALPSRSPRTIEKFMT